MLSSRGLHRVRPRSVNGLTRTSFRMPIQVVQTLQRSNHSSSSGIKRMATSSLSSVSKMSSPAGTRSFSGYGPPPGGHSNLDDNNEDTPFDFTERNYREIDVILAKYPDNYKASAIIPLLDMAQRQNGNYLTLSAMNKVAKICEVAPMQVYEVATFYTMFNKQKVGKYFIQLCGTTPCMICGSNTIRKTIEDHLGIKNGETTKDGLFTLLEVECLGACVNAPMVQINDDFYEKLTEETTIEVLEACKAGKPPPMSKWGSRNMNGQLSCEGPMGKTSLHTVPVGEAVSKQCRDLEPKVDPQTIKDAMYY